MKYSDKIIKSVSELIKKLKSDCDFYEGSIWYRGQSKKQYRLDPAFYRKDTDMSEMTLIKKFKQNATLLMENKSHTDFEWLFIMQHHGVPTRLLDWSESSLIALYFACCTNENEDGVLWVLLPSELNKHTGIDPEEDHNIPGINELGNYAPVDYHVDKTNVMGPAAAIISRNTVRMQAQQGTFTIFHRKKDPIELIGDKNHVWRYIIPSANKKEILTELKICGIDQFQLFPELSSIGNTLKKEFYK